MNALERLRALDTSKADKKTASFFQQQRQSRAAAANRVSTGGIMDRVTSGAAAFEKEKMQRKQEVQQEQQEQPRKANLLDVTIGSVKRGYASSQRGKEAYKQMMGQENELEEYNKQLESNAYNFEPEGTVAKGVSGAAEMLGQQLRQWTDPRSVTAAAGAAGLAAAAGQAGPQVLVPEEIITVPAAFAAGIRAGSTLSNFEIEAGNAYLELKENGISDDTAKKIALAVGGGNAALEAAQLDELFQSFKVLDKTGAGDTARNILFKELKERGVDTAKETVQEVAQEGVTIAGSQAASLLERGDWQYSAQEVGQRLGDTAVSSALSFGFMNVPGGVRNVNAGLQKANAAAKQTASPKTADRKPSRMNVPEDAFREEYTRRFPETEDKTVQEQYELFKAFASGQDVVETAEGPMTRAKIKERLAGLHNEKEIDQLVDSLLDEHERKQVQAQYFGETAGLVKDDNWKKAHLSSRDDRRLDALGKVLGAEIRFAETIDNGSANAKYENGVITLALDAENPVMTSVAHEAVHRLKEMDGELYGQLSQFVQTNMSDRMTKLNLDFRSKLYETADQNVLTEEMVADGIGLLTMKGLIQMSRFRDISIRQSCLKLWRRICKCA